MGLLNSFNQGNRSELLADYILSGIGISTPVRRQFDDGIDFYCNLKDADAKYLTFGYPFVIQIKSESVLNIEIGTKKHDEWRLEKISHIYRNELPFFVGFVDKKEKTLAIHDTTGLWELHVNSTFNVSHIKLQPNERDGWRKTIESAPIEGWANGEADGKSHVVDLGNPIIKLNLNDLDAGQEVLLANKINVLRSIVAIEQGNILFRNLSVKSFKEIKQNTTNVGYFEYGVGFRGEADLNAVNKVYNSINEPLIFLYLNLLQHGYLREAESLKLVLKMQPVQAPGVYEQMYGSNSEVFDWAGELLHRIDPSVYDEKGHKLKKD